MNLKKKILKRASILAVSGVVVGSMIVGSITSSVEAATRLYGVQQIVEGLADGTDTFDILEIVPDYSDASMGFYGDGEDVIIDSKFLEGCTTETARKEAIENLLERVSSGDYLSAELLSYQEQLYQPEDMSGWQIIDKTDATVNYYEERTGSFVLASDQGVSQGDYFLSPKLTLSLNLVDDDGNILDPEKASYKAGEMVKLRLSVASGRVTNEESDSALPAEITIFAGADGNAVDLTENLDSSDTDWNSQTHGFSIDDIVNLEKNSYDFTYTIPADNTGESFTLSAEGVVSDGTTANLDSGTYRSNQLEFVMGSTTSQDETTTTTQHTLSVTQTMADDYSEVTVVLSSDVPFADLAVTGSGFTDTKTVTLLEDANRKYSYTFTYKPLSSGQETGGDTDTPGTTNSEEASADTSASSESTAAIEYSFGTIVIAGTPVTTGESGVIELPYTETGSTENTIYHTKEIHSVEAEQVYNHSDFIYSEDGGSYIWVDGDEDEEGSYTASVPVGKIYYRTEIRCNNMFATHILELVGKTDAAENDDAAIQKIHVHTYTPSDLEAALSANELALNGMDLVYVSNSGILQGGGFDRAFYGDVDTTTGTYVNDLSWDTAFNIYEYAVNTNLPVILDHSIMQDNGTDDQKAADQSTMLKGDGTTDSGNNILRLSYLFRNYIMTGEKAVEEADTPALWTAEFVEKIMGTDSLTYGTYGLVHNSIFINMDDSAVSANGGTDTKFLGNLVCDTISDSIFVYESTKDNNAEGETVVTGMTNIVNEISNDNFYNNTNGNEYTLEYVETDGEITVTVSRATLVKYILNYNLRRVTLYKDTIRVLDLEPTKYSTLSEDDIRGWLGIESGSYSVEVTKNENKMDFSESAMTVSGQDGQYDYHTWISSNDKVITVTGSNRTGKLILLGAGTATITHEYGYYYHGYKYPYYETITLKVTANEASESHVKEITIDQYSTSEFIGKLDDLIETYDMVYIGDCIGPQEAAGSLYQDYYGNAQYNDTALNKKIYLHVGDLVESANTALRGLLNVDKNWTANVSTRYSGNDITEDKYQELLEYAQAGYPIVVSSKFYDGKAVSDTYLDNSSYIYKLIKAVANGFETTRTLTEEEYQKAVTEFGSEEAAASNGYKKTVNTSYSKDVTTTLTNKKLTKVKNFNELNANDSYIIANANTQSGYAYKVIDADRTMKGDLKTALNGVDSVTVSASSVENSYLWTLKNVGNNGYYDGVTCYLQNSEGKYLTIGERNAVDGAQLRDSQTSIRLFNGNEYINDSFAFGVYINNNNDREGKGYGYLNARTAYNTNIDYAGSYTVKDYGSSWYIYKVEDAEGETLTSRESITAAEYEEALGRYGAANIEANGYYKSTWTTYTYTQNLSGVPNVMPDNNTKSVINKLVKYINMPRLNLVMVKTPTPYTSTTDKSGNLSSVRWLESEGGKYYLKYEFEFANTAEATGGQSTYALQLYVDVNADGRYVPAEELDGVDVYEAATLKSVPADQLSSGVRYTASRELPQGYVGMLPWKFVISMNTGSSNELTTVRSSEIGYTAIENTSANATEIRVLQILPSEGALNLKTDSTFSSLFDSVKVKMNYNLDIEPKTVKQVEDEYKYGNYAGSADFYEKFLKQYDMLIWGYADMYGSKDFSYEVIEAFGLFIDSGKATLFSHDLTSFNNGYYGSGKTDWGYHMNQYLRSAAGMDRFGITESSLSFLKEKAADYKLTEEEEAKIQIAKKDIASKNTSKASSASSADTYYLAQGFANGFLTYYKDIYDETYKLQGDTYRENKFVQETSFINQTNEGQITLYPFDITITESVSSGSSETWTQKRSQYSGDSSYYVEETAKMKVAPTHYQYYQLDFNYDTDNDGTNNLVVWYTLAGGDYDNVPNDVRNDYYIYSVGNVTYTGMGHTAATELKEAQLFVNTIIAAYNAGNKNPGVNIVQDTDNRNTSIDYIYRTFDETSPSDNNQDESFAFYVDDTNMIQGTKTIEVWYYYEIPEKDYKAVLAASGTVEKTNAAGYYEVKDDAGNLVYLKAYSKDEIGNVLSEYKTTVDNKIAEQVTVKASWINSHLANAAEGNATIWIGAFTKLDYAAVNKATEYTDRVFDCVTFKKRNLTILD